MTLKLAAAGPVADRTWLLLAACRDADAELFFHPDGERGPERRARDEAAKAVCATCPVIDDCRAYADTAGETWGVWGGQSEDDRAGIVRVSRAEARAAGRRTGNQLPPDQEAMIRLLHRRGLSQNQISKAFGVCRETVRRVLRDSGLIEAAS